MGFKVRDLLISVLPSAGNNPGPGGGCIPCTGTTGPGQGQGHGGGCIPCTGTTGPRGLGDGCTPCTGTTGPFAAAAVCTECTYTYRGVAEAYHTLGCNPCTGTTQALCVQAAALAGCGICTGVSPALSDQRPEALAQLRQQLQGLIAEIEAEERRLEQESFPQSAEEIELLEKKLEEALTEVRSRKA
ncbi:MAG TPA: hypothetical protein VH394_18625, partial [Thermoanaerobaculia bacterium]|nr:hypothetical protein [Thermoanaerobaculia bacterium]